MKDKIQHCPDTLIKLVKAAQADGSLPDNADTIKVVGVIAASYAEHVDAVRCGEIPPATSPLK